MRPMLDTFFLRVHCVLKLLLVYVADQHMPLAKLNAVIEQHVAYFMESFVRGKDNGAIWANVQALRPSKCLESLNDLVKAPTDLIQRHLMRHLMFMQQLLKLPAIIEHDHGVVNLAFEPAVRWCNSEPDVLRCEHRPEHQGAPEAAEDKSRRKKP